MTLRVVRMVEERFHRDVEDRPIREGRTPSEFLREGDIEYKTCPYAGSRFQHRNPMNVSALRQAGVHWDAVLDVLARLRAAHDGARGVTEPGLWDIWRVSQLGSSLPWFFIFRDQPIPAYAAALSKMTLGMGIWAQRLFVKTITERWTPPPLTAESILELAESSGTLIGETEVCSGGDKMLLKFFDVLVTASPAARPDQPPLEAHHIPLDEMLRFGAHYAGFKICVWSYYLARRFLYADVAAQQGDSAALAEVRSMPVEPSDFFIVEPTDLAAVIPAQRLGWFRSLADLVVPFAPDASDLALRDLAFEIAAAMGQGATPGATWTVLDQIFGRIAGHVEAGLRGGGEAVEVPPELRDRLIGASPRELFK